MKTITRTLLIAGTFAAFVSCGQKKSDVAQTSEEKAIKITTAVATVQKVAQDETYSSTVEAEVVNNIAPQSGSRIQKINVDVGDFVSKGQILAEMDRVSLEQQKLTLINDSIEFGRIKSLYEEGGVSKSDYDASLLAYDVAKTSYGNLLENTVLCAPVSGVITARNYDKGDMYSMGSPIFVLQQITPVKMLVGVSETDYTKVSKGDAVTITADAFPGETFSGRVRRIYPVMDAASHTFSVEVTVANSDRRLRPGMYVKASISFGENDSVVVPDEAVVKMQGAGQRCVYVLESDNTVSLHPVTLGRHFGSSYEILSGLSEGDKVAVRGSANLKDGSLVEVIEG